MPPLIWEVYIPERGARLFPMEKLSEDAGNRWIAPPGQRTVLLFVTLSDPSAS